MGRLDGLITFEEGAKRDVLDLFGKEVDNEGMLVEKGKSQRVLTKEGEEISLDEWGGVVKGSEAFVKSDIISLLGVAKKL